MLVLLDHRRAIVFGTAVAILISGIVSLFLPKGYQAGTLVLVTPPKAASDLKVAPEPLHMTTAYSLANSDEVLVRTLDLLSGQNELLQALMGPLSASSETTRGDRWSDFKHLGVDQVGTLLNRTVDMELTALWEDLPPIYLLPGIIEMDTEYLDSLDSILLNKHLTSRIRTSLENMHEVEYQPVLVLQAEWESPVGAALLSHAWAKSLIRMLKEQYLIPTLELQEVMQSRFDEINQQIETTIQSMDQIREETNLLRLKQEKEILMMEVFGSTDKIQDWEILPASSEGVDREPLYVVTRDLSKSIEEIKHRVTGDKSLLHRKLELQTKLDQLNRSSTESESASGEMATLSREHQSISQEYESGLAQLIEVHETIYESEALIQSIEADLELLEMKRDYLIGTGAYESQSVNYEEMLGVRLMSPPTPPQTHVSPVIWKIVLLWGIIGFVFLCLLVLASHTLLRIPPERFMRE